MVLGRTVANGGFLAALFRADPLDAYHFFLLDPGLGEAIAALAEEQGLPLSRLRIRPRRDLGAALRQEEFFCFHLSDCLTSLPSLAAAQARIAPRPAAITGVTHSLSYARFGLQIAALVGHWTGREAVVATSQAGAKAISQAMARVAAAMPGLDPMAVQVIPLGIAEDRFVAKESACPLELPAERLMVLVPGRVSPYSKMDLMPLLRAVQALPPGLRERTTVVAAGSLAESHDLMPHLAALAANAGLDLRFVDSPTDAEMRGLLHRAQVVVSVADNVQETFGLVLLEAQAAGVPVIASDWDGYRDLVRHGETGLLVPTLGGTVDAADALLAPLLFDTDTHLWLAQAVAVHLPALTAALEQLLSDDRLRHTMGQAAQRHGASFAWPRILERYLELWEGLARAPLVSRPGSIPPWVLDYEMMFAGYPRQRLEAATVLSVTPLGEAVRRGADFPTFYATMEDRLDLSFVRPVLTWARQGARWGQLVERITPAQEPALRRTVLWMAKNGLLEWNEEVAAAMQKEAAEQAHLLP